MSENGPTVVATAHSTRQRAAPAEREPARARRRPRVTPQTRTGAPEAAEQGDHHEREEPRDVEVEPVRDAELQRDEDRRAERRQADDVAPARHEREHDRADAPPATCTPSWTTSIHAPSYRPQTENGEPRSAWKAIDASQKLRRSLCASSGTNASAAATQRSRPRTTRPSRAPRPRVRSRTAARARAARTSSAPRARPARRARPGAPRAHSAASTSAATSASLEFVIDA